MTLAAFHQLLEEIDLEGGPQAARHNRLHLLSERPAAVTTAPTTPPSISPALAAVPQPTQTLPVGQLLKWADEHPDSDIRDQAARARAALTGLRRRYDTDQELTSITTEAELLEKRLAELRARETELAPPKAKQRKKTPLDYDSPTVRAWAREAGIDCPAVGRIPKAIVTAWRASLLEPSDA